MAAFEVSTEASLEHLLPAAVQSLQLLAEPVDPPLGLDERFRQRLASPPFADEVQEVRAPALLGAKLGLLETDGLRDVRVEFCNLLLDPLEDVAEAVGPQELISVNTRRTPSAS